MQPLDAFPRWDRPPRPETEDGRTRCVGVELEFNGLGVAEAAATVAAVFGGEAKAESAQRWRVTGAPAGAFLCELDVKFAHRAVESDFARAVRDTLASATAEVLPIEIVCPPIPWTEAHALDRLRAALAARGALGTRASPFFAFGVQLNPELASLRIEHILAGFRAFLALRGWLRQRIAVDPSRRIWSFEAAFGEAYCRRVMAVDYAPDLAGFIDDYLAANPTRNRELDLLPLLTHLDADRVRRVLPDETIKARPTWHYRLPNSEIDAPDWSLALEWKRWVAVERLAASPRHLREACDAWETAAPAEGAEAPAIARIMEAL